MRAPYKHRRRLRAATASASAAAVALLAGALLLAAAPDGSAHAGSWTGSVSAVAGAGPTAAPATPQTLSRMNERTILQVRFDGR